MQQSHNATAERSKGRWRVDDSTVLGTGDTPMEALADLVRALASGWTIWLRREDELHRAIHNSPDALAKELREAERDLHTVQQTICSAINGPTTAALEPLWRAERALTAFAARLATNAETRTT